MHGLYTTFTFHYFVSSNLYQVKCYKSLSRELLKARIKFFSDILGFGGAVRVINEALPENFRDGEGNPSHFLKNNAK